MDRAGSSIPSHFVATIFTQSILYGAFFVVFVLTYWALVFRPSPGPHPKKSLFCLSSTMFILATLHIISSMTSTLTASESNSETLRHVLPIFGKAICLLQILVGDSIGLYRCWIVLGRCRIFVAFPFLLFLGSIAAGIGILINLANFKQGSMFNIRFWTLAFFSLSFAINMICTLTIATRIWFLSSSKGGRRMSSFTPMILESGALYSIILVILLLLLATQSWFQYILLEALPSIIGILFSILLIRIGLGLSIDGPQPSLSPSWSSSHTKFHYSKSSHPPKYLNSPINPSSPTTHSHHPFLLPLILSQNQNLKEKHQLQIEKIQQQQQQQQQQQHYNLRSQLPQPSSYFRTSEDIDIDIDLEFEIDEARCRRPKSLPLNPRCKIYTITL